MIILLFHVLYLFSKFVYDNILNNKQIVISDDAENTEIQFKISKADYLRDSDAPQYFEDKRIRFYPPVYIQRYMAVANVLKNTKYPETIRKVVDFGCAELDFLMYLKNTAGIQEILCVDIDVTILESYKHKAAPLNVEYINGRTTPLVVEICEGSVTHNDKKLENTDAVICIELIEHLYPDTLTDVPYNIFGYIKPKLVVITTPNADFNVLFPNLNGFRHHDHKFEWTRQQFEDWAANITLRYPDYVATFEGVGSGPEGTEHLGSCTQMAVFKRIRDEDVQKNGVEGLFKTIARHEYPFRTDNRSDEEKLLDEATYYIRHLSFQEDMEEEVPLEKLLHRLKSFHISVDGLQTILEEAGWEIENRDSGPVVLVPPPSYSDYGTVEHASWNSEYYETENEDDWNRESDPSTNWDRFMEQDSTETWGNNHYWNEEPSIVNPIVEDNTHPYDGENTSLYDGSEMTESTETLHNPVVISSKENLNSTTNIHELSDSCGHYAESCLNESVELSDASLNNKAEDMEHDLFLNTTLDSEADAISSAAQQLNRTLDQPLFLSVSRASTSPEPYLLQAVKMDRYCRDDSMSNQSMSADWMLNDEQNISTDIITNASDDSNRLHSIYVNTSYQESKDSDIESCGNNTGMNAQQNEETTQSTPLKHQVQQNNSIFIGNNVFTETEPWYTSSPKIKTKITTLCNKRRSLDYKDQECSGNSQNRTQNSQLITVSSNNSLGTSNKLPLQSNTDINISTVLTVNLSTIKEQYNEEACSMNERNCGIESTDWKMNYFRKDMLTNCEASLIVSTLNDDKQMVEMSPNTSSSSKENRTERDQTLQMNVTSISTNKLLNLCPTEELMGVKQKEPAILTMHSKDNDTKSSLSNRELVVKSCDKLVSEHCDGKTDVKFELHNLHDLKNYTLLNNFETTYKDAKDINDLQNTSLVSSPNVVFARGAQNTSVLKSELDCNMENREYKCKTVSLNSVDAVESTEMKPASPENMETPPNSWSPEVMDSGYPNTASAPDMTPEYDLSSIAQDHPSDSESPSIAEAPRLGVPDVIEVENGDLANNNRDGEGNNMLAPQLNDLEDLQPLIDVLENDLENENDIYVLGNGFPIWLLRILNMANPIDVEMHMRDHRQLRFPNEAPGDEARYVDIEHDEGFDGSSEENSVLEINDVEDDVNDANENALMNDMENDNKNAGDT